MGILSKIFGKKQDSASDHNTTTITPNATTIPKAASLHLRGKADGQGLFPSELVMLAVAPRYKVSEKNYPAFLSNTYEIANPIKMLVSLQSRGFITVGKASDVLPSLKLTELKEIAESIGVTAKGKKADIVAQLSQQGEEVIAPYIHDRNWALTESGAAELKANPYIQYFLDRHSYSISEVGIDIWSVNEALVKNPKRPYRDILFRQINDKCNRASLELQRNPGSGSYNSYTYCQCTRLMGLFVEEEGKSYISAADYYFQYLFRRINIHAGLQLLTSYGYSSKNRSAQSECIDRFYDEIQLLPFHRTELGRLIDESGIDDKQIRQSLITSFQRSKDTGIMSEKEAADFVILELSGELDKSRALSDKAAKQAIKKLK